MRANSGKSGQKSGKVGRALIVVGVITVAGVFALDELQRQRKPSRADLQKEIKANLAELDRMFERTPDQHGN